MTINEYQQKCLKTAPKSIYRGDELLMGLLGLNSAVGECMHIQKKVLYQGHPFDRERLARELCEAAWCLSLCAHALDYDLETVLRIGLGD